MLFGNIQHNPLQPTPLRLTPLMEVWLHFSRMILAIPSIPLDCVLRPRLGTCYVDPLWLMLTGILMAGLWLLGTLSEVAASRIPFVAANDAPMGLRGVAFTFFIVAAAHVIRLLPKIKNQALELHSEDPGPPWFFLTWLPAAHSQVLMRIFYEPMFAVIVTGLLAMTGTISMGATIYLSFASYTLSGKNLIEAYIAWKTTRVMNDRKAEALGYAPAHLRRTSHLRQPRSQTRSTQLIRQMPPQPRQPLPASITDILSARV